MGGISCFLAAFTARSISRSYSASVNVTLPEVGKGRVAESAASRLRETIMIMIKANILLVVFILNLPSFPADSSAQWLEPDFRRLVLKQKTSKRRTPEMKPGWAGH